ncbi:MAG: cupin domain-containing protein [Parvularculaceae bacterium]
MAAIPKPETVNLAEKYATFDETWSPRIVAEANGQHVRIAKLEGAFVWHKHDDEDELFIVMEGDLTVEFRDADGEWSREVGAGELIVVPRGLEHRPVVREGAVRLVNITKAETKHTGETTADITVDVADMPRV